MSEHCHSVMDRQIFNLKLSVEATSAYILVTSLIGDQVAPTLDTIKDRWTVDEAALISALAELEIRKVIQKSENFNGAIMYYPNPAPLWQ